MQLLTTIRLAALAACALFVAAAQAGTLVVAEVALTPYANSSVFGKVVFFRVQDELRLRVSAEGLTPGAHGFLILAATDCAAGRARQRDGHFDPAGRTHGQHLGDLPNLFADAAGKVDISGSMGRFVFDGTRESILGHSLVITAAPDNHVSQPDGNAGLRVACGVIALPAKAP